MQLSSCVQVYVQDDVGASSFLTVFLTTFSVTTDNSIVVSVLVAHSQVTSSMVWP